MDMNAWLVVFVIVDTILLAVKLDALVLEGHPAQVSVNSNLLLACKTPLPVTSVTWLKTYYGSTSEEEVGDQELQNGICSSNPPTLPDGLEFFCNSTTVFSCVIKALSASHIGQKWRCYAFIAGVKKYSNEIIIAFAAAGGDQEGKNEDLPFLAFLSILPVSVIIIILFLTEVPKRTVDWNKNVRRENEKNRKENEKLRGLNIIDMKENDTDRTLNENALHSIQRHKMIDIHKSELNKLKEQDKQPADTQIQIHFHDEQVKWHTEMMDKNQMLGKRIEMEFHKKEVDYHNKQIQELRVCPQTHPKSATKKHMDEIERYTKENHETTIEMLKQEMTTRTQSMAGRRYEMVKRTNAMTRLARKMDLRTTLMFYRTYRICLFKAKDEIETVNAEMKTQSDEEREHRDAIKKYRKELEKHRQHLLDCDL